MDRIDKNILVIGGGIAGIQASLDLAEMGYHVDLIEKEPCIGGRMAQLDKTLPTNDCSICILAPKLSDCFRHPNIQIHSLAEVQHISKGTNKFSITINKKARFVHEDKCINCGLCLSTCPSKVDDKFDMKMRKRKAIYLYYLQGVPAVMAIDKENCLHLKNLEKGKDICRLCQKGCPWDAIDFTQKDREYFISANAIIVAVGSKQFDPSGLWKYKYGKCKNIITGLEYERLISASGPTNGIIQRLTDENHPKEIGFIQCVGSRDIHTNSYCSSICCTYATKHAILSKEHDENINTSIFYIDLRAGGKGFQKYLNRAQNEYDVKFVRGMISEIEIDEQDNPILLYEDLNTFEMVSKKMDLVILECAMIPFHGMEKLTKILNVELDKFAFINTTLKDPLNTNIPGIFACGSCRGPMDIPSSVIEASGVASKAAEFVAQIKFTN